MKEKKLKLFVWRPVLSDYTDGVAVALAYTASEAKKLLIADGVYEDRWDGIKLDGVSPERYLARCAVHCWGGG